MVTKLLFALALLTLAGCATGGVSSAQFAAMRDELAELRRTSDAQQAADAARLERLARENDELAAGTRSANPPPVVVAPANIPTQPPQNPIAPQGNSFGAMMGAPSMGGMSNLPLGWMPPERIYPFVSENTAFLSSCPPGEIRCYQLEFAGVEDRIVEIVVNDIPAKIGILRSRLPNRMIAVSAVGGVITSEGGPRGRYTDWVPPSRSPEGRVNVYIPHFTHEGPHFTNKILLRVYNYNPSVGTADDIACEIPLDLRQHNWGSNRYSGGVCP